MESSKTCRQEIYIRFNSSKSPKNSLIKDEELAIYATPENESTSETQIVEHYEKLIGNWSNDRELLELYENIISYYTYLIWESKVKTLKKHMKIISECIVCSLALNPESLVKFKHFKYANCFQNQSPEFILI